MQGCLLIHGFTGSPYEVEPLAEFLRKKTDWNVKSITLPGHGDELNLRGVTSDKWIEAAEEGVEELLQLCDKVYVIGFSMGGLLASYLAYQYPVEKLVLLSAAAYYVNPKQLLKDTKEMIRDGMRGQLVDNELFIRYKNKIGATPISATLQFRRVVRKVRPLLKEVEVPTLIAQGLVDGIVPPKSAKYLYEQISATQKEVFYSPVAKHLICHSEDCDELFERVFIFLNQ
ncbi:alpha/beta hydrolase [Bacillus coahuilensis]|uniref:alpha/beta hydrolase n=1 Tax=Bacillus coahuilensis TaxID=408580 RepID=UPI00018506C8|nr:alpha/beta fold hydrolase [Bacillus coahuilensis]